jgi:hypothetical protein
LEQKIAKAAKSKVSRIGASMPQSVAVPILGKDELDTTATGDWEHCASQHRSTP